MIADSIYAFVLSCHRSGSTLLTRMLGAHPGAVAIGELPKLAQARDAGETCSCGIGPPAECPFWSSVLDHARQGDGPPSCRALSTPVWGRVATRAGALVGMPPPPMNALTRSTFSVLDAVLQRTAAHAVVDSTKDPARAISLLRARPESCRIIQLVRDGRAVCSSMLRSSGSTRAWHRRMRDAARRWRASNIRITSALRHVPPGRRIFVRYEDLCTRTEDELERLCAFLGLTPSPSMLRFGTVDQHLVGGDRMRFERSIEVRADERWRYELGPEQLAEFDRLAGYLNREFGY